MSATHKKKACSERRYEVRPDALPVSCPGEHMRLWDAHPRVFLALEKTGHAVCPYCGAEYVLKHD